MLKRHAAASEGSVLHRAQFAKSRMLKAENLRLTESLRRELGTLLRVASHCHLVRLVPLIMLISAEQHRSSGCKYESVRFPLSAVLIEFHFTSLCRLLGTRPTEAHIAGDRERGSDERASTVLTKLKDGRVLSLMEMLCSEATLTRLEHQLIDTDSNG